MNRFEAGIGDATKNIPTMKGKFEDIAQQLQAGENRELSSVKNEKPITFRLKKAVSIITAGVLLLSATPAFAENEGRQLSEEQRIELQIETLKERKQQLERQGAEARRGERFNELRGYLNYFKLDGLKLGQVKMRIRSPVEQLGVFLNEKHLGDIYAHGGLTFSRQIFIDDVLKVLEENGFKPKINVSRPQGSETNEAKKFNINPQAQKILDSWDGYIDLRGSAIYLGSPNKLEFDANTKRIDVISPGEDMLIITCEDYDGKRTIITCVNKTVKNISEIK